MADKQNKVTEYLYRMTECLHRIAECLYRITEYLIEYLVQIEMVNTK
jgi:hypothetical protein